jgi:hypothetical protein
VTNIASENVPHHGVGQNPNPLNLIVDDLIASAVIHRAFSDEVSEARIFDGFHYRFSTKVGQDMGYRIGEYVVRNFMQPVTSATR